MNDEEPPLKKNKLQTEPTLNLSLPDDLIVSILARLSRLYYPTLFFVSKHFRSLLTSQDLYKARSLLGRTENCLYVCLRNPNTDSIPRWFMLFPRPNGNLTNEVTKKKNKSNGYILVRIPTPQSPPAHGWTVLAVGSNIYKIGGSMNGSPSTSVSILDCWSHTWLEAPSMLVEREYPSANLLDGKIYVTGGCHKQYNWMEVFDLKTKTWEYMLSPAGSLALYSSCDHINHVVVDGKLYIIGDNMGVVYDPKKGWEWSSTFVIENVLYNYSYEEGIKWYDSKKRSWKILEGMKKLPNIARRANVRMADYGGKMALFWDKFVVSGGSGGRYQNKRIWCAMIALERRNSEEIWGKVEWFDAVLPHPIPKEYEFEFVVAVNVWQ